MQFLKDGIRKEVEVFGCPHLSVGYGLNGFAELRYDCVLCVHVWFVLNSGKFL